MTTRGGVFRAVRTGKFNLLLLGPVIIWIGIRTRFSIVFFSPRVVLALSIITNVFLYIDYAFVV